MFDERILLLPTNSLSGMIDSFFFYIRLEKQKNRFQQMFHSTNAFEHSLMEQIDRWENESIRKIQQTADETRQQLIKYLEQRKKTVEMKLMEMTTELKQICREDDLDELRRRFNRIEQDWNHSSIISIQEEPLSTFVNKISLRIVESFSSPTIDLNTKWLQRGITVAGGNGDGYELNQLHSPSGIFVDEDRTIYVVDSWNHRIVKWIPGATSGKVVAGGNGAGDRNDQLNYPVSVAIDRMSDSLIICDYNNRRVVRWPRRNGTRGETIISNIVCYDAVMSGNEYLYISDVSNHEVRRWKIGETNGVLVAGGHGRGDHLDHLDQPYHIFVDQDHCVYVSDYGNHRVMKWLQDAREGILIAGGQGQGSGLNQLSTPRGIVVDQLGTVYVADCSNHRVVRWAKRATEGSLVVGGNGQGTQANQFSYPMDLSFDQGKNLYVTDRHNHRTQQFLLHGA